MLASVVVSCDDLNGHHDSWGNVLNCDDDGVDINGSDRTAECYVGAQGDLEIWEPTVCTYI